MGSHHCLPGLKLRHLLVRPGFVPPPVPAPLQLVHFFAEPAPWDVAGSPLRGGEGGPVKNLGGGGRAGACGQAGGRSRRHRMGAALGVEVPGPVCSS